MAHDRKRAKQRRVRRSAAALARGGGRTRRLDRPDHAQRSAGILDHAWAEVDEFDAALIAGAGGVPVAPETERRPTIPRNRSRAATRTSGDRSTGAGRPTRRPSAGGRAADGGGGAEAAEAAQSGPQPSGAPIRGGNRAIGFLRASWAELQRVQWPDRRQVTQATAVVLGFVAIAGALSRPGRLRGQGNRGIHTGVRVSPLGCFAGTSSNTYSGHENKVKHNLEHRLVVAGPAGRRPQRGRPHRSRLGDEGQPEDHRREAHDARLRAGEHGDERGLLGRREGDPGRDRLRRSRAGARPTDPGRGRPAAAQGGRNGHPHARPVRDRGVGQGRSPVCCSRTSPARSPRSTRMPPASRYWYQSSAARPRSRWASTRSKSSRHPWRRRF